MNKELWIKNDGGRSNYFKGTAGDCAARAMAIALGIDYKQCYDELAKQHQQTTGQKTARNGIFKKDFEKVLNAHGWHWCSAPVFDGRKAKCSDLTGIVIARQAKHYVAVINGIAHDIFDSTDKMVYGFWQQGSPEAKSSIS
ncbi:hypothetical protein [Methylophaga nitratireducenticrescens]|uniref:hypothetical protein n=1 Tax=Methylophaga nitratireducenticrescens TaxID=754476 RepID=UPI000CDC3B45|nr:hypothetical protein [Methylophaga nitratireducenticrescens]AUZ86111.1 hypothetical protein CDW43_15785 [Methylophaga nitratireducenticrescens]